MFAIYSLCPAPWGTDYRLVEVFDTEDDAKSALDALEKVNVLFNCYTVVEHDYIQTNRHLRSENRLLRKLLFASATLLEIWNPADDWFPQIEEQFSKHMVKIKKALKDDEEEVKDQSCGDKENK